MFIGVSANILTNKQYALIESITELKEILLLVYLIIRINRDKESVMRSIDELKCSMVHQQSICENINSTWFNFEIRKCYKNDTEPCAEEYLKECPVWLNVNRCSLVFRKLAFSGEVRVLRGCDQVGPCLAYENINTNKNMKDCNNTELLYELEAEYEHKAYCFGAACNKHFQFDFRQYY
ncbi:hypothetical protein HDE_10238 [Halotydeus destructor]|nr:hypothetical protein HDE_10238 [Halotydeus destructor]